MTTRPRATDISGVVKRLGSRRQGVVDAARARLCAAGPRAVEALVEALESDSYRARARAMPLIALIGDARGIDPLRAMLLDRDLRIREVATRCLARFPTPDVVATLERVALDRRQGLVRVAAVQSLLEIYAAGQEQAVRRVLSILLDGTEDSRVRLAAFSLIPRLKPAARRDLLRRLRQDPSPALAERAAEFEESPEATPSRDAKRPRPLLVALGSTDYAVWHDAVSRLAACGAAAVAPLIAEMQRRAHDPVYCARAGMALKAMGPRQASLLAEALDRVEEPVPLQVLVEVAGALGHKPLIYGLKGLIDRIATRSGAAAEPNGFDPMERVRAKAHLELARVGSRVAIEDLKRTLRDPDRRLEIEIPAAAEVVGKREEMADLLLAYGREDRFLRERIAAAVRAIMRRERIRRDSTFLKSVTGPERRSLEAILTRPRAGARGGPSAAGR